MEYSRTNAVEILNDALSQVYDRSAKEELDRQQTIDVFNLAWLTKAAEAKFKLIAVDEFIDDCVPETNWFRLFLDRLQLAANKRFTDSVTRGGETPDDLLDSVVRSFRLAVIEGRLIANREVYSRLRLRIQNKLKDLPQKSQLVDDAINEGILELSRKGTRLKNFVLPKRRRSQSRTLSRRQCALLIESTTRKIR